MCVARSSLSLCASFVSVAKQMASDLHLLLPTSHPQPLTAAPPPQQRGPFSRQKLSTPLSTTTCTPNSSSFSYSLCSTIIKTQSSSSSSLRRSFVASALGPNLNAPLISPHDTWGNWTALFAAAAFGIWYFCFFANFYHNVNEMNTESDLFH